MGVLGGIAAAKSCWGVQGDREEDCQQEVAKALSGGGGCPRGTMAGGAKKETVLVEQWAGGAKAGGASSRVGLGGARGEERRHYAHCVGLITCGFGAKMGFACV